MDKEIENLIRTIKECAKQVLAELGHGWKEEIYQKAMEVALRHHGIMYETQRILPITFADHVIGESIPDLVVWFKTDSRKIAIVIDLKAEPGIKEEHKVQVERYIKELKKQLHKAEEVYKKGLVVNFIKEATSIKLKEGFVDIGGIQILEVKP